MRNLIRVSPNAACTFGCLLRLVILLILFVTLLPFDFQPVGPPSGLAGRLAATRERPPHHFDAPGNLLLFLPFGLALAGLLRARGWASGKLLLAAAGGGAAFSMGIEATQLFLPSRDPSVMDVLMNSLGAALGGALVFPAGRRIETWARGWVRAGSSLSRRGLAVAAGVHLLLTLALPVLVLPWSHRSLRAWDSGYLLALGNEADGSRPWRGTIWRVEFAARSLAGEEAERVWTRGLAAAAGESFLGRYWMDGANADADPAGTLPQLEWRGAFPVQPGQGTTFDSGAYLRSVVPPGGLLHQLSAADAFTLAVEFATADTDQEGPARIVTLSEDDSFRNFTLGQWHETLVFRLRTPLTGENGAEPELYLPGVCQAGRRVHVLISFDGRTVRTWVDGRPGTSLDLSMRPGAALLYRLLPGRLFWMKEYEAIYALLVFPAIGWFWLLWRTRSGAGASLLMLFAAIAVILMATAPPFRVADGWLGAGLVGVSILLLWPCARPEVRPAAGE